MKSHSTPPLNQPIIPNSLASKKPADSQTKVILPTSNSVLNNTGQNMQKSLLSTRSKRGTSFFLDEQNVLSQVGILNDKHVHGERQDSLRVSYRGESILEKFKGLYLFFWAYQDFYIFFKKVVQVFRFLEIILIRFKFFYLKLLIKSK